MPESAAYSRRGFDGNAAATALASSVSLSATTFPCVNLASWSGFSGSAPGCATLDRGLSTEEKIEFTGVSGNDLTGVTRGVDGTSAVAHNGGATVEHTLRARDADEANLAVVKTIGQITAVGSLLVGDAVNSLDEFLVGANDTILMVDTALTPKLKWAASAVPVATGIANAVGSADTWARSDHVHQSSAEILANFTTSVSVASVTLSSIPATYTTLLVSVRCRTTSGNTVDSLLMRFNGDTGSNYRRQTLTAADTAVSSESNGGATSTSLLIAACAGGAVEADSTSPVLIAVPTYSESGDFKTCVAESGIISSTLATNRLKLATGMWQSTAAINSITFLPSAGSIEANSSFVVYGLR